MLISLTLLLFLGSTTAKLCGSNKFWSSFFEECKDCSTCTHPDIVILPCQGHRDTVCGPMSDLNIDWSWMKHGHVKKDSSEKEMTETFKENMQEIRMHEMYTKERAKQLLNPHSTDSTKLDESSDKSPILDNLLKQKLWDTLTKREKEPDYQHAKVISRDPNIIEIPYASEPLKSLHFSSKEAHDLLGGTRKELTAPKMKEDDIFHSNHLEFNKHDILVKPFNFVPVHDEDDEDDDENDDDNGDEEDEDEDDDEDEDEDENTDDEVQEKQMEDFSTTERLILDWQTGILAMAVASCFVFFLVAACYSLNIMGGWRTVMTYFDKDDLQKWMSPKKTYVLPSRIYKATTEVAHKDGNNCKYLERIISKNAKKFNRVPGNLYHGNCINSESRPLTADEAVHKPNIV